MKNINKVISLMERMNNIDKYGYSSLLTESQESSSQKEAKNLVQQRFGWDRERADKFVREELRNDITALRDKKIGKFTLGVARMYCDGQIQDATTISNLNATLALMIPHINEYDRNLNGLSAEELINRFKQVRQDNTNQKRGEIDSIQFGESQYTIIPINSYEEAQKYYKYTYSQSPWCLTHMKNMYDTYTCDGINQIYFCLKNGFENIEPIAGANTPLDEYGLSMISVIVNESGELAFCTCRWNHRNGGSDSVMDEVTLSKVLNVNFYNVFKPNNKWVSIVSECVERLRRGEKPKDIFDEIWRQKNGLYLVELMGKFNYLRPDGTLVWKDEKWFDGADYFDNGLTRVYITGKGENFLRLDGTLVWEDKDKWFDETSDFDNGLARVYITGKGENFLRPDGTLVWKDEKWFDETSDFDNGLARVKIKGKGDNFLRLDGTLVWEDKDKWFDKVWRQDNGIYIIKLMGKYNFVRPDGAFVGERWFNSANGFYNGLAMVEIKGKGWNYLRPDGTLVWKDEKWFDDTYNFHNGLAMVKIESKGYNYLRTDGTLVRKPEEKWFDDAYSFHNGLASVVLDGEGFNLDRDGNLHDI